MVWMFRLLLNFKHIVDKHMVHFFGKVDTGVRWTTVLCNSVLVILKDVISSNVCVMIMVLLYITVC